MGRITRTNYGLVSEVRLSNAVIKLLTTTPQVVVPAKLGTIWLPLSLSLYSDSVAGVYATTATFQLGITGALTYWNTFTLVESELDSGALSYCFQSIVLEPPAHGPEISNLPLLFSANANPTGGNAANFAILRVHYVETPTT